MTEIETKSKEYWREVIEEKREKLRELILDNSGELVSREELVDRLEDRDIEVWVDEEGTTHYDDTTLEKRAEESEDGYAEAKTAKWPVTRASIMVETGRHPSELDPVEVEAERMAEFDKAVTPVFNEQAKNGDFPLEYPPKEEE